MKTIIASIALLLALTGCGTADCGSDGVLEAVSEMGHELQADSYRALGHDVSDAEVAEQMALKPKYVRMTDHDIQTGTYSCDARLIGRAFDPTGRAAPKDYEWKITFTVTPDAAGDYGDYIVEVRGESTVEMLRDTLQE